MFPERFARGFLQTANQEIGKRAALEIGGAFNDSLEVDGHPGFEALCPGLFESR